MTSDEVIVLLGLEPLAGEGGYFRQTYKSRRTASEDGLERPLGTCIYYLLTKDSFSAFHKLSADEIFHFYLGDPVDHVQIAGNAGFQKPGGLTVTTLGSRIDKDESVQLIVPAGVWQALRLRYGGSWALLGTNMCPGFADEDHVIGKREELLELYPLYKRIILELTR